MSKKYGIWKHCKIFKLSLAWLFSRNIYALEFFYLFLWIKNFTEDRTRAVYKVNINISLIKRAKLTSVAKNKHDSLYSVFR